MLHLLLADPACRCEYNPALLDAADARRGLEQPALTQRDDWQSSRFLKQQYRHAGGGHLPYSLSHSRGYAALAYADNGHAVGVDVEAMRRRDFAALLGCCARAEEIRWWQWQANDSAAFYALWGTKEALIKAAGLDFPADLRRVGLFRQPHGHWQPGVAHGQSVVFWQGFHHPVAAGFMLACVWPVGTADSRLVWHPHGTTDWRLPDRVA